MYVLRNRSTAVTSTALTISATERFATRSFGRIVVMPNLKPPVRSVAEAKDYFDRIMACVDDEGSTTSGIDGSGFQPLMTLYLTDATTRDDVIAAKNSGLIHAYKLYPAGATTNSEFGVTSLDRILVALQVVHRLSANSNLQYDESVAGNSMYVKLCMYVRMLCRRCQRWIFLC